jgi:hypothetical protein
LLLYMYAIILRICYIWSTVGLRHQFVYPTLKQW